MGYFNSDIFVAAVQPVNRFVSFQKTSVIWCFLLSDSSQQRGQVRPLSWSAWLGWTVLLSPSCTRWHWPRGWQLTLITFTTQVKCSEAWNISIKYDRATANSLAGDGYISEHDRRLRTLKWVINAALRIKKLIYVYCSCFSREMRHL